MFFFFYFKEITDHITDEIIKEESCRSITPSLNMYDMDERDWTSLESSSESIDECSGDEEMVVSLKTTQRRLNKRKIPEQKFRWKAKCRKLNLTTVAAFQSSSLLLSYFAVIKGSQLSRTSYFPTISTCTYYV